MNIPEEVLKLAASEVFDELPSCAMCLTGKSTCVYCTDDATRYARAALSAAAPTLMAMAWDEGNRFGIDKHCESGCYEDATNNPYRKEAL